MIYKCEKKSIISTVKSRVLTRVFDIMDINFLPKGHSQTSNLKKLACASKQDGLVLATLGISSLHSLHYGGKFENLGVFSPDPILPVSTCSNQA